MFYNFDLSHVSCMNSDDLFFLFFSAHLQLFVYECCGWLVFYMQTEKILQQKIVIFTVLEH